MASQQTKFVSQPPSHELTAPPSVIAPVAGSTSAHVDPGGTHRGTASAAPPTPVVHGVQLRLHTSVSPPGRSLSRSTHLAWKAASRSTVVAEKRPHVMLSTKARLSSLTTHWSRSSLRSATAAHAAVASCSLKCAELSAAYGVQGCSGGGSGGGGGESGGGLGGGGDGGGGEAQ